MKFTGGKRDKNSAFPIVTASGNRTKEWASLKTLRPKQDHAIFDSNHFISLVVPINLFTRASVIELSAVTMRQQSSFDSIIIAFIPISLQLSTSSSRSSCFHCRQNSTSKLLRSTLLRVRRLHVHGRLAQLSITQLLLQRALQRPKSITILTSSDARPGNLVHRSIHLDRLSSGL